VSKASPYEPDVNDTHHLAENYGVAVLPARARRPKNKANVHNGVLVVTRWVLTRLRHQRVFSLNELNWLLRSHDPYYGRGAPARPARRLTRPVRLHGALLQVEATLEDGLHALPADGDVLEVCAGRLQLADAVLLSSDSMPRQLRNACCGFCLWTSSGSTSSAQRGPAALAPAVSVCAFRPPNPQCAGRMCTATVVCRHPKRALELPEHEDLHGATSCQSNWIHHNNVNDICCL
jgi:hypothetical protein